VAAEVIAMEAQPYDVVVVGGGAAGLAKGDRDRRAARVLRNAARVITLRERSPPVSLP
jgi:succinate dehydrogenase/fumarate reductase flavoprotein subunit